MTKEEFGNELEKITHELQYNLQMCYDMVYNGVVYDDISKALEKAAQLGIEYSRSNND